MTTQSLEKAFAEAAKLSAREQDALAAFALAALLTDEIKAEKRWDAASAQSQDMLAALAGEDLAEHK